MALNTHSLELASASSQAVSITDASALKPTGNFTIEAWVKTTQTGRRVIFQSYSNNSSVAGIRFEMENGQFWFWTGKNTGTIDGTDYKLLITDSTTGHNGIWQHVAMTWDGSTMKIYVNGQLNKSVSWANAPVYAGTNYVRIGCGNDTGTNNSFYNGSIDEVRLWSAARTQAEIVANMFRDVAGDTNLIDSWKLNNNYTSGTGNNNGTAIATPTFNTTPPFTEYRNVNSPELSTLSAIITSKELNASSLFTAAELNTVAALLASSNLKGYWRFESNANDSSSSGYNLTPTNSPTYVSGKFGNGADLEASSSQYFTIADGSCPNLEITGSKTWGAWVKPESIGSWQYIMSKFHNASQLGVRMGITDGGLARFQCKGLTTNEAVNGVTVLQTGIFYHVVGVYDSAAGKLRIYVNGTKEAELTASGSSSDSNTAFDIGTNSGDQHLEPFDGVVDDVFIFNSALTDAEIQSLANLPVGYWRLESNFNDSAPYGYNLSANGSPSHVTGKFGNGVDLEAASNQYATLARASCPNLRIAGSQTWGAWIKPETLTSYQYVMSTSNGDGSNNAGLQVSVDSGNIAYFTIPGLTTNTQVNSGTLVLENGKWAFIVGVYDSVAGKLRIYVNGVLGGEVTATGSKTDISTGGFGIGARGGAPSAGTEVDGIVDDAFIFNRALTITEIQSLYKEPLAYYKLENVNDSAEYGRTLTNNGTTPFNAAKFNNGADLGSGTNTTKYLSSSNRMNINGKTMSLSMWVLINTNPSSGLSDMLFDLGDATSHVHYRIFYNNSGGTFRMYFRRTRYGTNNEDVIFLNSINLSVYNHLVITYNGTVIEAFINGISLGTFASSGDGASSGTSGFTLGEGLGDYAGNKLKGIIDDVAIFSRPLTAAEVFDIYTGVGIAYTSSLGDTIGNTDSILRALTKISTDSTTVNSAIVKAITRGVADTAALISSIGTVSGRGLAFLENIIVNDLGFGKVMTRILSDSKALAEAFSVSRNYFKSLIDSISNSETINFSRGFAIFDNIILVEKLKSYLNGVYTKWHKQSKAAGTWAKNSKAAGTWAKGAKAIVNWTKIAKRRGI